MKSIYIIGSLRNEKVLEADKILTDLGLETFSDWYSAGPEADDYLRDYYRAKGMSYSEALNSYAAKHIFEFDKKHLDRCDSALLVYPAGRSAHLELGYVCGLRKPAYVLMDGEPERYDLMLQFATKIFMNNEEMIEYFRTREELAEPR